jgi:hypothetical protein
MLVNQAGCGNKSDDNWLSILAHYVHLEGYEVKCDGEVINPSNPLTVDAAIYEFFLSIFDL